MEQSKQRYKNSLRMFWTTRWKYISLEQWIEELDNHLWYKTRILSILSDGLYKLVLEKKLEEDKVHNLLQMLQSPDKENVYMGLSIMQKLRPKKFKKKQKI